MLWFCVYFQRLFWTMPAVKSLSFPEAWSTAKHCQELRGTVRIPRQNTLAANRYNGFQTTHMPPRPIVICNGNNTAKSFFFSRTGTRQMAARSRRAVVVENICAPTEGVLKFGIQLKLSLPTSAQSLLANSKGRRSDMWGIWTTQANRDEDEREYGLPWTVLQEIVTSKARPALAFDEKRRIKLL